MRTPTQALADHLLRKPVEDWVHERRQQNISFRRIALELRDVTKGKVDVTEATIRTWAPRPDQPAEQAS